MNDKGEIIEVILRYHGNIVLFLYNVKSIEEFKKTVEYAGFKNLVGDQLRENILIDKNENYIQPDASIILSIARAKPTIDDFRKFLNCCLMLFDIHSQYKKNIRDYIMSSYPTNDKNFIYHNIAIMNKFEAKEQYIIFDYLVASKKSNRQYNLMSNNQ